MANLDLSDSPRVVLIADQLVHLNAGTESQMLLLCEALLESGWKPQLAVLRNGCLIDKTWPTSVHDLEIVRLWSPLSWWRALSFAIRLRLAGVRVAHIFFNDAAILLPPILRACGIGVVVSRRDMGFWYTRRLLRLLRFVRRFVDYVVVNSAAVARNVISAEGYTLDRIAIIYNAVATSRLEKLTDKQIEGNNGRRAGSGSLIGIVANLRAVKRVGDAVVALSLIASKCPEARLEIIGAGDSSELRSLAEQFGIEDRIQFIGAVSDVSLYLHRYDVCLSCSESEGLSNAIIEYLLAGCAVIASQTGGNPELVIHGETGLLYPVGDTAQLAAFLEYLLSHPSERARLGQAGRCRTLDLVNLDLMVKSHVAIYRALIERRTGSAGSLKDRTGMVS